MEWNSVSAYYIGIILAKALMGFAEGSNSAFEVKTKQQRRLTSHRLDVGQPTLAVRRAVSSDGERHCLQWCNPDAYIRTHRRELCGNVL